MRTSYEQCVETDECLTSQYCSFASENDIIVDPPLRKCLPKYSQDVGTRFGWESIVGTWENPTIEDLMYNGQYCMSGLAFPESQYIAKCTKVHLTTFPGVEEPLWDESKYEEDLRDNREPVIPTFQCDPTDNEKKC